MSAGRITGLFLGLFITLALTGCGSSAGNVASVRASSGDSIVGGKPVESSDPIARSIVALYMSQKIKGVEQHFTCTGTIIADNLVITAAHCIGDKTSQMIVVFGMKMAKDSAELRPVVAWTAHPRYARMEAAGELPPDMRDPKIVDELRTVGRGDVGLVRFAGGLPEGYERATIATTLNFIKDGSSVTLAGYGMAKVTTGPDSGTGLLRRVNVDVALANFKSGEILMDQTQGRGACMGDSGGPALIQNQKGEFVVFGVTSSGMGPGYKKCQGASSYTSIPAYLPWLTRAASALDQVNARESIHGNDIIPVMVDVRE